MKITMVKKLMADGSPCKKCREIEDKMRDADQLRHVDRIVYADENDQYSEGMLLSAVHGVDRAPFFIVEEDGREPRVYSVYFKFVKEVLNASTSEDDEIKELMNDNPDLDFI